MATSTLFLLLLFLTLAICPPPATIVAAMSSPAIVARRAGPYMVTQVQVGPAKAKLACSYCGLMKDMVCIDGVCVKSTPRGRCYTSVCPPPPHHKPLV